MPIFKHRGFAHHYEARGDGPTFVWCHGMFMSTELDRAFWGLPDLLASSFHVIAPDARGHGKSSFSGTLDDFHWNALATDLIELLDHLEVKTCILGGGSMGAMTALHVALEQPQRVRGLVLFQPTAVAKDVRRLHRLGRSLSGMISSQGMGVVTDLIVGSSPVLNQMAPEKLRFLRKRLEAQPPEAMAVALAGVTSLPGIDAEVLRRVESLATPTLLVAEPQDPLHPKSSAEQLHAVLPNSHLEIGPSNLHYVVHVEEMAALIERHVNQLERHE